MLVTPQIKRRRKILRDEKKIIVVYERVGMVFLTYFSLSQFKQIFTIKIILIILLLIIMIYEKQVALSKVQNTFFLNKRMNKASVI